MHAAAAHPEDALMRETTEKIDAAARRVSDIVERVRRYARGQGRPVELVTIGSLMRAGLEHFSHASLASGVETRVSGREDLMVEADPLEMGLVFLNLVRNAAQACARAGVARPVIELSAGLANVEGRPMVIVTVDDNGPGFDARTLASLERSRPQAHSPDGLGLGLMIVRTILEHHSGGIVFQNRMREGGPAGGRVIVRLPPAGGAGATSARDEK